MKRLANVVILACSCLAASVLIAQPSPEPHPSQLAPFGLNPHTELKVATADGSAYVGKLISVLGDSLFMVDSAVFRRAVPVSSIETIFVRPPNRTTRLGIGIAIGVVGGMYAGGKLYEAKHKNPKLEDWGENLVGTAGYMILGGIGFGVIGGVVANVGNSWKVHWTAR